MAIRAKSFLLVFLPLVVNEAKVYVEETDISLALNVRMITNITIDTYIENEYKVITFSPRRSVTFKKDEIVYAAYKEILTTMKYIKSDCKITLKPNEDASIGIKSLDCNKVLKLSESSI